jgi:hypothetical protein
MRMAEITDVRLKDIPALCFNGVSVGDLLIQGRGRHVGVLGDLCCMGSLSIGWVISRKLWTIYINTLLKGIGHLCFALGRGRYIGK